MRAFRKRTFRISARCFAPTPSSDDERVGVHRKAVACRQLVDALAGGTDVDAAPRSGLVAEDDVLPDREVVGQHEVLEHHADPDRDRVLGRAEVLLEPVRRGRALVGRCAP